MQKFRKNAELTENQIQPMKKNNSEKCSDAKKLPSRAIFYYESSCKDANTKSPCKTVSPEDFGTTHAEKMKVEKKKDFLISQEEPVIESSQGTKATAPSQWRRSNTMKSSKSPMNASIRPDVALGTGALESAAPVTPGLVMRSSTPTVVASKQVSSSTPNGEKKKASQSPDGMSLPAGWTRSEVKEACQHGQLNEPTHEAGKVMLKIQARTFSEGTSFIDAQVHFDEQGVMVRCVDAAGQTQVLRSSRLPGPIDPELSSFKIEKTGKDLTIMLKRAEPVDAWKGYTIELYRPDIISKDNSKSASKDNKQDPFIWAD